MPRTLREIAARTGLSTATVSHALRGLGRMTADTRQRVLREAQAMGYRPSSLLSRAFANIRQPEHRRFREVMGFITEFPPKNQPDYQAQIAKAVERHAAKLGYLVESFCLAPSPATAPAQRRLSRTLVARGIRGVIVMPRVNQWEPRLMLNWDRFAAVEIGHTLVKPHEFHRVERSLYYELHDAFDLLARAGYRRIGLAVSPREDATRRGIYSAAFLAAQMALPRERRLPPAAQAGPWGFPAFRRWLRQWEPEVLIIQENHVIEEWLMRLKLHVPRDISLFSTGAGGTALSGLRANMQALGEAAVELTSLLLNGDEIGRPRSPRCWLVKDFREKGTSLRRPLPAL